VFQSKGAHKQQLSICSTPPAVISKVIRRISFIKIKEDLQTAFWLSEHSAFSHYLGQ